MLEYARLAMGFAYVRAGTRVLMLVLVQAVEWVEALRLRVAWHADEDGGRGTGGGWQKAALARGAGRLALKGGLALGQLGAKGLVKSGTGALALSGPALGCSIQAGSRLLMIFT